MDKNFNTSPYYDDFDQSKNYLRILFKPGYAVQARELTQLQTAINKQITDFGSHIFKDGSIVLNGNTNLYEAQYVNVDVSSISVSAGDYISGGTSDARGKVIKKEYVDATTQRVYFTYVSSSIFSAGETITVESSNNSYTLKDTSDFSGKSSIFSIDASVFFIKGNFVYCDAQDIVIDNSFFSANLRVGLDVTEAIVTYDDDETLLDPAQGSNNYAAPGADRYTIALSLNKYRYDPQDEGLEDTGNFIELARITGNQIVSKVNGASYSNLETTLARRTFDESGDYTVKAFGLSVKKHIYGDVDKFSLAIDAGKAYVKGYEFETISTQHVDLDKALDLAYNNGTMVQVDFGSYMFVNTPTGALNYSDNQTVNIKNASGAVIGTGTINALQYNSTGVYKLYLYNVTITSGYGYSISDARSFSLGNWSATVSTATYGSAGVSLIKSPSLTSITRLPNSPINTLLNSNSGLGDTQYVAIKSVTATFTNINESDPNLPVVIGGTINVGAVDNEVFISSSASDYIVQNISTGQFYNITSLIGGGGSRTLVIDSPVAVTNARVYTKVAITQAQQSNKSLQTGTKTASITNGKISLATSDCYELVSITARSTFNTTVLSLDVTDRFIFNNGQKDDLYDHGWVQLKSGASISASYDEIDIVFSYFSHSTTSGFFSVDSYTGAIDYDKIPTYTSSKGEVYQLNSCLDFRPVRANGDNSTAINGSYKIIPESIVSADYSYYMARIDKLVLTKERKFSVIKGIPAVVPTVPEDMFDAMTLYIVNIPPFTNSEKDVSFTYIDNRRYTMRDIGKIDKRIQRIEYYTSLSFLEKQAKDESIPSEIPGVDRFKNGILVDSFAGHSVGNASDPDYACSIDKENRILRPKFAPFSLGYVPTTLTNAVKEGDLITLPYTEESFLEQPYATTWVNVNPYAVFDWNGSVSLTPATDNWVETHVLPAVTVNLNGENDVYTVLNDSSKNTNSLGVVWDDWRTVVKGAVTNIQDNYQTTSNSSTLLNVETGGQTVSNTTLVTNNESITTTSVKLQTGIQVLTSDTKILTKDLGSKVVDTSIVPYVRSRTLTFAAKNLKPKTLLFASFDGVDVGTYCSVALEVRFSGTIDPTYTRIRNSANTKTATMILAKTNRAFVQMDQGSSAEFVVGDAVEVFNGSSWVSAGTVSVVTRNSTLTTNDQGDIAGFFKIPDPSAARAVKFRTGELIFRLSDSLTKNATTAAEVKYVAQGLSQSTERTIVATRVATATIKPVSNQTTNTTTTSNNIVVSQDTAVVNIPPPPAPVTLMVDDTQFSNSKKGTFEYLLDFTTSTGEVGIRISPSNGVPVRYSVTWDGHTYTTGFVGNSSYDNILVANGYPKVTTNHVESLSFTKTSATPQVAYLKVEAPIVNSDWGVKVLGVPPPVPVPTYTITSDKNTVNEGGIVTYTVGTTNVPANTVLYWTLEGTATSADFADSASSGSVTINQLGAATFTRTISSDLTTEGTETFKLNLRTGSYSGTIVASSSSVTIIDTSLTGTPSYSIRAESALVDEGVPIIFTVNTRNVADNTVLYWTLSGGSTAAAADFSGGSGSGSVTIINNTATFSRFLLADNSAEGNETFSLDLRTSSISGTIVATSETVTVVDNSAIYSISAGQTTVDEGYAVQFIVSTQNVANGTTLYWKLKSGSTATGADFTDGLSNGSVVVQNNNAIVTRSVLNDALTDGNEKFQLELLTGSVNGTSVASSQQITIIDTSATPEPIYSITADKVTAEEGEIVTFTVSTQNVANTTLYWTLDGSSTASSADFVGGTTTGSISLVNGIAVFTRQIEEDATTEGAEVFKINLKTGSTSGTTVASSQQVSIIDTSKTSSPAYAIAASNNLIIEGDTVLFSVSTKNVSDDTTLYWRFDPSSTVSAADLVSGSTSGTVSIVNNSALFSLALKEDSTTEGSENFKILLSTTSNGSAVANTADIYVVDTSSTPIPVYSITSDSTKINEGDSVTFTVSTQNVANGTVLYWTMTATPISVNASDFVDNVTTGSVTIQNSIATFRVSTRSDAVEEGNEVFTLHLRTGSITGTIVATSPTVTIVDVFEKPSTYNISADVSNIGTRIINQSGITYIPHTPVMMESKSLGAAVTVSWNGVKNNSAISSNVRYQLTSLTVSDPRIKLFSTEQKETYKFPAFPGWNTNGSSSVTPFIARDLYYDNPMPSYVGWRDWWNCSPPQELTANPPTNSIKTSGQAVPVYMVFNPYAGHTVATGWGGDFNWIAGNRSNVWGPLGPQQFQFTLTATWEYVSGDDSIPLAQRTIVDTSSGVIRIDSLTQYDPVAQTFFVSAQQYPNGVFIKSIDLFFKSKSSTAPVEVQIRPTVNGYPSSSVILPFASIIKEASQINVSATGTVATNFKFSNVIHLAPGEYSFVVITNTDEYNLFTSKIGDFSLANTSQRITSQPLLGSMFKSQNASAWTPVQEEDVKFKLYKCAFSTTQTGSVIYNADTNDVTGDVPYEVFFTSGEVVDFDATDIKYAVKNSTTESFVDYQLGSNVEMPTTKTLLKSTPTSMQFKTTLSSNSRDVTPIIDINRLSSVLVKNTINNDSTDETLPFGGKSAAKYITRSVKLNPGFDSTDLKVYFNAKLPVGTSVKVYYKISSASDTVFVDNNYTEMEVESAGTYSENKYVEYKYKTPWDTAFQTGERFDTFSVKIVMLSENPAKVPMIKDLRVVAIDV